MLWFRALNVAGPDFNNEDGNTVDPAASAITALATSADGFIFGGTSTLEKETFLLKAGIKYIRSIPTRNGMTVLPVTETLIGC
ncbi:MAG: hypothetical protein ABIA63_14130 [bacterium]